ncbi:MAG: hypothetical protein V1887_02750 [Candidatus Aenigmatarchaeota archaeon]
MKELRELKKQHEPPKTRQELHMEAIQQALSHSSPKAMSIGLQMAHEQFYGSESQSAEHEAYMRRPDVIREQQLEMERERSERERKNADVEVKALGYVLGGGTFLSFLTGACTDMSIRGTHASGMWSVPALAAFIVGEAITVGITYMMFK